MKVHSIQFSRDKQLGLEEATMVKLLVGHGIQGDRKAGGERELFALPAFLQGRKGKGLCQLRFQPQLYIEGCEDLLEDDIIRCGQVLLQIKKKGKACHENCQEALENGKCGLGRYLLELKVLEEGTLEKGAVCRKV